MRLSGNLLVYNEARYIEQIVRHYLDYVDELVILDGGSADGTVELIRACDDPRIKLLSWPQDNNRYRGDFKEVVRRNLMIEASSGDYILSLDADELIGNEFRAIADALRAGTYPYAFTAFPTYHFHGALDTIRVNNGEDVHWYPNYHFRLFRNHPSVRYRTRFANGLHCSLHHGRVPLKYLFPHDGGPGLRAVAKAGLRMISRSLLGAQGWRHHLESSCHLLHYHYVVGFKENDLRTSCVDKQVLDLATLGPAGAPADAILVRQVVLQHPAALKLS